MKPDRVLRDAALCCVVTGLVLGAFLFGGAGQAWNDPTATQSRSGTPSPAPSAEATESGPRPVYLVTLTPEFTATPSPTPTTVTVPTIVPECVEGKAVKHLPCREPFPTSVARVNTPIAVWVSGEATPGVLYLWE